MSALADGLAALRPTSLRLARRACKTARRAGNAARACYGARRTLDALSRAPRTLAGEIAAAERRREPPRRVDPDRALEALADAQVAFAASGLEIFLIFGTLLGAIRQQGFIPGDGDVDLGVFAGDGLRDPDRILSASALTAMHIFREDDAPQKLALRHRNGCELDVKVFRHEPDGAVTWHTNLGGAFAFRKRFPGGFGLKRIDFLGLSVNVPDRAEAFLEWQYGPDWRVPDPSYHMVTSGPLHGPEQREFSRLAGPEQILRTLDRGRTEKALAMTRSMAGLFPEDALWPRLAEALEAGLASTAGSARTTGPAVEKSAQ